MQQIVIQLPSLPLQLICTSTAHIGFSPMGLFKTIVEYLPTGEMVVIDDTGIKIGETEYKYNTGIAYKSEPLLLKWLQGLQLQMPAFNNSPFGF